MCVDPATFAMAAGGISTVAQTVMGASGSIAQGQQGAQNAWAGSAAAMLRAQTAEANAKMALAEASGKIGQIDTRVGQTIGQEKVYYGGANIDSSSGSPLAVMAGSAAQGNIDKQLAAAEGENRAAGAYTAETEALQKASTDQRNGEDALKAGYLGAGTAVLGGISKLAGLASFGSKAGVFSSAISSPASIPADPLNYWSYGR